MKYEAGKVTVLCNDSGALLNLYLGKDQQGNRVKVTLHPRKGVGHFDIEEILDDDPKRIKRGLYHLRYLLDKGKLSWHPKGSDPKCQFPSASFSVPTVEGQTVPAPRNAYDEKINELLDKEKADDEKTKAGNRRDLRREEAPAAPVRHEPSGEDLSPRQPVSKYDGLGAGALLDIAMSHKIIQKVGGGYYKFGEVTLARGKNAAIEALEKDESTLEAVKASLPS